MAGRDATPGGHLPGGQAGEPGGSAAPPSVLRSWDEAEARLFPLVMAQPELYEQALDVIHLLLGRLRETCPDLAALLTAHERGDDLVADLTGESAAGISGVAGVRPGLIAAAACAMRYREIVALMAAQGRLAALARAREQGLSWAVVEENGQADRAPYVPYQRVEADVGSGRAVIVSIGPDETLSRAVYRLDAGQIDVASGVLRIGEPVGSYLDHGEFETALRRARTSADGAVPLAAPAAPMPAAPPPITTIRCAISNLFSSEAGRDV